MLYTTVEDIERLLESTEYEAQVREAMRLFATNPENGDLRLVEESRRIINREGEDRSLFRAEFIALFQYEGFDPAFICAHMQERAGSKKALIVDLVYLAVIFYLRGTNIMKMQNSMSAEGKAILIALSQKYSLVSRVGTDKRRAVTIGRVMLTFPTFPLVNSIVYVKKKNNSIRECVERIHIALRQNCMIGYYGNRSRAHMRLLALAYGVVQSAVISKDKKDNLGTVKKYHRAAQEAKKLDEIHIHDLLKHYSVEVPPANWVEIEPMLGSILAPENDREPLVDVANKLDSVLSRIIPAHEWVEYVNNWPPLNQLTDAPNEPIDRSTPTFEVQTQPSTSYQSTLEVFAPPIPGYGELAFGEIFIAKSSTPTGLPVSFTQKGYPQDRLAIPLSIRFYKTKECVKEVVPGGTLARPTTEEELVMLLNGRISLIKGSPNRMHDELTDLMERGIVESLVVDNKYLLTFLTWYGQMFKDVSEDRTLEDHEISAGSPDDAPDGQ